MVRVTVIIQHVLLIFFPSTHVSYPLPFLRLHCSWLSLGNNPFLWASVTVIHCGKCRHGQDAVCATGSHLLHSGDCSDCFTKTSVSSFNPVRTWWNRRYRLHFPDQETETKVICPRLHSQDSDAGHLAPELILLITWRLLAGVATQTSSFQYHRAGVVTELCIKCCRREACSPASRKPSRETWWLSWGIKLEKASGQQEQQEHRQGSEIACSLSPRVNTYLTRFFEQLPLAKHSPRH